MQVIYFIHSLYGAGTTRQADLVCRNLKKLGTDITLLVGSDTGEKSNDFNNTPYPVRFLSRKKVGNVALTVKLAWFLRKQPQSLLLSGAKKINRKAITAHKLARHRGPLVLTLTNNIAQRSSDTGKIKSKSLKAHYKDYQYADKVIVLSRAMMEELSENGFNPQQLAFCPPPIDIELIQAQATEMSDHKWLSGDIPVIVSAGRFDLQKNFPLLISAFAKAREKNSIRLIILGEGDPAMLTQYQAMARNLGVADDMDFAGFKSNPFAYFARADLFALSSDWEGFGLVLAEALVCGAPVLSTDCPHGPAEVLDGTQNTVLTPVGDVESFARGITELLGKKSGPVSLNLEKMRKFDAPIIAEKYKNIIDDVIRNH